jgi:hypothetical protein
MEESQMLPSTVERVPRNTADSVNRAIHERIEENVVYYERHRAEIPDRLDELDHEWDVERALATGSSCLSLAGLALGFLGRPRWFLLPLGVQAFYLQHTLQGWCPPLPVLRRLGFRTPAEIDDERSSLEEVLHGGARTANLTGRPADHTHLA